MNKTVTHSAVTVGTTSNQGQNPYKLTLQAGTTAIALTAKLNAGAQPLSQPGAVRVWYGTTTYDMTAAAAVTAMARAVNPLDCGTNNQPAQDYITNSELIPVNGDIYYSWLEWGQLPYDATLTVTLVEYP